jgi:hypothetical protein
MVTLFAFDANGPPAWVVTTLAQTTGGKISEPVVFLMPNNAPKNYCP